MKESCAAPIAEFHPARAGPSELKLIAANPNRSRPVGYAGVFTADQNLALPEVVDRSRMRKRSSLSMSPAPQSIDPPCSKR
jgi:hypothetical protein